MKHVIITLIFSVILLHMSKVYSKLCQTSKMERFAKIVYGFQQNAQFLKFEEVLNTPLLVNFVNIFVEFLWLQLVDWRWALPHVFMFFAKVFRAPDFQNTSGRLHQIYVMFSRLFITFYTTYDFQTIFIKINIHSNSFLT